MAQLSDVKRWKQVPSSRANLRLAQLHTRAAAREVGQSITNVKEYDRYARPHMQAMQPVSAPFLDGVLHEPTVLATTLHASLAQQARKGVARGHAASGELEKEIHYACGVLATQTVRKAPVRAAWLRLAYLMHNVGLPEEVAFQPRTAA